MGRSTTPKYVVRLVDNNPQQHRQSSMGAWRVKDCGRPTAKNLEKYVHTYGKSLEIDGCNAHISKLLGYVPYPTRAIIVKQATNEIVAEWVQPAFYVW